jgi:CheY-like chemotaxis protein
MSKKLLLADDSITIQKVIQITFAHEDYDLTITDNGDAALAKAKELKPDLVMADVYMPGKNGYELTSAIKQDPALLNTPVLLLAGSFEPFDEEKARSCQANDWIEKPFESQNLIDKVAELLSSAPAEAPEAQPVAEPAPVEAEEPALGESSLVDFDQPATAGAEAAAESEDAFGDISFAEETPVPASESSAAADDWSDVAGEPEVVAAPAVEETFVVADDPATDITDDYSSTDEGPAAGEEPSALDTGVEPDVFDMAGEEIMPLGDDDILDTEDLEPVPQEQTLAAWSRDAAPEESIFTEPSEMIPEVEEDVFAATETVFGEEPTTAAVEPETEATETIEPPVTEPVPVFAEPVVEPVPPEEPLAAEDAPEPAAVAATIADVEEKVSALSEDEIEQMIEKVVTNRLTCEMGIVKIPISFCRIKFTQRHTGRMQH